LGEEYRSLSSSLLSFLHSPVTSPLLCPNILLNPLFPNTSAYVPPSMWATKFHTHTKQQAKLWDCFTFHDNKFHKKMASLNPLTLAELVK
jgi:hypothetical protein